MEQQNKNLPQKKEMPEHIKRMFEQKRNALNQGEQNDTITDSSPATETQERNQTDVQPKDLETSDQNGIQENDDKKSSAQEEITQQEVDNQSSVQEDSEQKDIEQPASIKEDKLDNQQNTNEQDEVLENKKPKNKKRKKLSKKQLVRIFCYVVIVGAIIGIIINLMPEYTQMEAPVVNVYSLSNQTVIHVEENKDAKLYEFYIQREGQTNVTYLRENTNIVYVKQALKVPGVYKIWARYSGFHEKQTSNQSKKVTYYYYQTLDTPKVAVSQDKTKLVWEKISQAKEYKVYYGVSENSPAYFIVNQPAQNVANVEFDLSELQTVEAGRYLLNVQAISSSEGYYKDSNLSGQIEYDNIKTLSTLKSASFSSATNIISFAINTQATRTTKFEISINNGTIVQGYVSDGIKENHSIDLTPYTSGSTRITDIKIKALGDGKYITDSEYFNVIIN